MDRSVEVAIAKGRTFKHGSHASVPLPAFCSLHGVALSSRNIDPKYFQSRMSRKKRRACLSAEWKAQRKTVMKSVIRAVALIIGIFILSLIGTVLTFR